MLNQVGAIGREIYSFHLQVGLRISFLMQTCLKSTIKNTSHGNYSSLIDWEELQVIWQAN
jgi:hypothetical protein